MAGEGVAGLVAALSGGGGLEQAAYDKAMQRMLDQKNTQAQIDQRVQEAYMLARQNEAQQGLDEVIQRFDPRNPDSVKALTSRLGLASGLTGNWSGNIENISNALVRPDVYQGRLDEGMTDPNALTNAFLKNEMVPGVAKIGDVVVDNLYSKSPTVNEPITNRMAAASAAGDKAGTKGVREQKIQDAMDLYGMDRGTAVAFVDNYIKQDINEKTGNVVRTNILPEGAISIPGYGAATEIPMQGGTSGVAPASPPSGQTFYELANYATGIENSMQDLIARGVTLFGADANMDATKAIQTINTGTNEMIRALSINPRFPVGEIERLRQEIKMTPGWFTSPDVMRGRMESVAQSLTTRMRQAERDAADPSLSNDIRQAQSDNAVAIRNFLPQLGVPGYGGVGAPNITTAPPPPGANVIRFEMDANGNLVPVQ